MCFKTIIDAFKQEAGIINPPTQPGPNPPTELIPELPPNNSNQMDTEPIAPTQPTDNKPEESNQGPQEPEKKDEEEEESIFKKD